MGIDWPREELDARLAARTRAMLAAGFVDEVRGLLADGFGAARAMRSVGYRQIAETLATDAALDELALEQASTARRACSCAASAPGCGTSRSSG